MKKLYLFLIIFTISFPVFSMSVNLDITDTPVEINVTVTENINNIEIFATYSNQSLLYIEKHPKDTISTGISYDMYFASLMFEYSYNIKYYARFETKQQFNVIVTI